MRSFHAVILMLALCTVAFAQSSGSTTASLTGQVRDATGAVIGGATVVAHNVETNLERSVQSEEDGSYLIIQLPPGDYLVTANVDGFNPFSQRATLTIGTTSLFNLILQVSNAASEVIVVQANSLSVEGKTEKATNIDRGKSGATSGSAFAGFERRALRRGI